MRLRINLYLDALLQGEFPSNYVFDFQNITNLVNWHDEDENVTELEIQQVGTDLILYVFLDGSPLPDYDFTNSGIEDATESGYTLTFTCDISNNDFNKLFELIEQHVISINVDGNTSIFAYKQNSDNNALSKNLTLVTGFDGKFNQVVGLKNIDIDIKDYARDYNYIYIPILHRYYYVDSIEFISADFTRLHLKEDVLMSWKDLIKQQDAFITRMQNSRNRNLVDVRFPVEDTLKVEYVLPTPTPSAQTLVNTILDTNLGTNEWKILVSSISANGKPESLPVPTPNGTTLPTLSSTMAQCERIGFLTHPQLESLIDACIDDDNITTFINAVVLLPFNPYYTYNSYGGNAWLQGAPIQANDKFLCTDGKFHTIQEIQDHGYIAVQASQSYLGSTPYFIVDDFTLPSTRVLGREQSYLDYEPYTTIELYVAFVGWVKLNNSEVLGKRLIVYYTLDYKTGMGTAFIYNVTDNKLIYSTNCQFGVKLDLTTTNTTEITRQKQANELNMILGLMSSALAIGVGVATENPVAIAGGVLSAGKTIASNVNSNRMLFERAQTSFGTSEGVFHSPITFGRYLRYSYHEPIISDDNSIYAKTQGYPVNTYQSLSTIPSGYVEVGEIHFDPQNNVIYQDEISEIVELLKNGVII